MNDELFVAALRMLTAKRWTVSVNQFDPQYWEIRSEQGSRIEGQGMTLAGALIDMYFRQIAEADKKGGNR